MRQENIEITIKIPLEIGKQDKNGVIYTRKAVEIALDSYSSCPIVFLDKIVKSGIIYYGGTCENRILEFGKKDETVKYYAVGNIGFSE